MPALVGLVVVVLCLLGTGTAFDIAAADLHSQAVAQRGESAQPRTLWGIALSDRLASDVEPKERDAAAIVLGNHADRLRELAGVVALGGLLFALFTGDRRAAEPRRDVETSPLASTSSNGTV